MIDAVFRAGAIEFDVDGFLARHPELQPCGVWRVGEKDRLKRRSKTSGFNVLLVEDGKKMEKVLSETRLEIERLWPALRKLRRLNVEVEIDFGVMVGSKMCFAPSILFPPEALAWFSKRGLEIRVSSYPCSDDDE